MERRVLRALLAPIVLVAERRMRKGLERKETPPGQRGAPGADLER